MRLLLDAVRKLPEREQDTVLALLLSGGLAGSETWHREVQHRDSALRASVAFLGVSLTSPLLPESEAKVVPIRFPRERYDELKAWCEGHNFPMAAVVRGLVERFLESQ